MPNREVGDHCEWSVVDINKIGEGLTNLQMAAELLNSILGLRNNSIDSNQILTWFWT